MTIIGVAQSVSDSERP